MITLDGLKKNRTTNSKTKTESKERKDLANSNLARKANKPIY
jgi:hypothetical protein